MRATATAAIYLMMNLLMCISGVMSFGGSAGVHHMRRREVQRTRLNMVFDFIKDRAREGLQQV
jgi:hypothetical protein